jgi:hypothetical protein
MADSGVFNADETLLSSTYFGGVSRVLDAVGLMRQGAACGSLKF